MVYTSESLALAMLEVIVHTDDPTVLSGFSWMEAKFKENLAIDVKDLVKLPRKWTSESAGNLLNEIGRQWLLSNRSAILQVPSVDVPTEFNYLINPAHPDFTKVSIGKPQKVKFDTRFLR